MIWLKFDLELKEVLEGQEVLVHQEEEEAQEVGLHLGEEVVEEALNQVMVEDEEHLQAVEVEGVELHQVMGVEAEA